MVDKQTVLQEYEEMLMGNRKTFGNVFPKEPLERKKAIAFIWRYAIEDYWLVSSRRSKIHDI